jgi:flagellar biosynthesis regulator FlaF
MRNPTDEEKELRATIIALMVWVRENTVILPSANFKTFDDAFCFAEALLRKTAWMDKSKV